MAGISAPTSCDDFLGGKLSLHQPLKGHRSGVDAVLLAAATEPAKNGRVLDLGAGVGVAGLLLKWRRPDISLSLLDINSDVADLARMNAAHTHLAADVILADIGKSPKELEALGLAPNSFDHVLTNPPFYKGGEVTETKEAYRATAHVGENGLLPLWIKRVKWLLKAKGKLTLIHRADALSDILSELHGFGDVKVLPIFGRADRPAERVIVDAQKGRKGPLRILPPLVLNDPEGGLTPAARQITYDGYALPLDDVGKIADMTSRLSSTFTS